MLRRLLAAMLAAALALPVPAFAGGGCSMARNGGVSSKCCCNAPKAAEPSSHCKPSPAASTSASTSASQPGCGCELRADTGHQPATGTSAVWPTIRFSPEVALIPAKLSTPQRLTRCEYHRGASPPGAGAAFSRSQICSWLI